MYQWQHSKGGCAVSIPSVGRIAWLSDLVRLELLLWNRVDARLRAEHDLPLAYFWPLFVVGRSRHARLRVGELSDALGLTVGGTSKIVDRIVRVGLLQREADPRDRRASIVVITPAGEERLNAASVTYAAEMATVLDAALSPSEQEQMHNLMRHLLKVTEPDDDVVEQPRAHIDWDAR